MLSLILDLLMHIIIFYHWDKWHPSHHSSPWFCIFVPQCYWCHVPWFECCFTSMWAFMFVSWHSGQDWNIFKTIHDHIINRCAVIAMVTWNAVIICQSCHRLLWIWERVNHKWSTCWICHSPGKEGCISLTNLEDCLGWNSLALVLGCNWPECAPTEGCGLYTEIN